MPCCRRPAPLGWMSSLLVSNAHTHTHTHTGTHTHIHTYTHNALGFIRSLNSSILCSFICYEGFPIVQPRFYSFRGSWESAPVGVHVHTFFFFFFFILRTHTHTQTHILWAEFCTHASYLKLQGPRLWKRSDVPTEFQLRGK